MLKKFQSYTATYQHIVFVSLSEFTLTMDNMMDVLVLAGIWKCLQELDLDQTLIRRRKGDHFVI